MSNTLRKDLIKLAYTNPELREHLLPILKEAATFEDAIKGKRFKNPQTGNDVLFKSLPKDEQKKIRSQWKEKEAPQQMLDFQPKKIEEPKSKSLDVVADAKKSGKQISALVDKMEDGDSVYVFSKIAQSYSALGSDIDKITDLNRNNILQHLALSIDVLDFRNKDQVVKGIKNQLKTFAKAEKKKGVITLSGPQRDYIGKAIVLADQILSDEERVKLFKDSGIPDEYAKIPIPKLGLSTVYDGLPSKTKDKAKKLKLTDGDVEDFKSFAKSKPDGGTYRSPAELKRRFLAECDPLTKKRVQDMSPEDFIVMLRSIMDEEEGA